MKKQAFVLTLGVVLLAVMVSMGMLISAEARPGRGAGKNQAGDYRLSGPYTHKNLSIFLVHGKNVIKAKVVSDAAGSAGAKESRGLRDEERQRTLYSKLFESKMFTFRPATSSKVAQQDRMIGVDLIVPPRSGKLPISAFCVEHGRWSGRGNERAGSLQQFV